MTLKERRVTECPVCGHPIGGGRELGRCQTSLCCEDFAKLTGQHPGDCPLPDRQPCGCLHISHFTNEVIVMEDDGEN